MDVPDQASADPYSMPTNASMAGTMSQSRPLIRKNRNPPAPSRFNHAGDTAGRASAPCICFISISIRLPRRQISRSDDTEFGYFSGGSPGFNKHHPEVRARARDDGKHGFFADAQEQHIALLAVDQDLLEAPAIQFK